MVTVHVRLQRVYQVAGVGQDVSKAEAIAADLGRDTGSKTPVDTEVPKGVDGQVDLL